MPEPASLCVCVGGGGCLGLLWGVGGVCSGGVVCPGGLSAPGGCLLQGVSAPGGVSGIPTCTEADTPLWTESQTPVKTLPWPKLRCGR